jgi:hypothetical protein
MRWRKHSKARVEDSVIVQEAQAVLNGTVQTAYADWQRRPSWVYVNQLAHADAVTLRRLADSEKSLHPATWGYACAVLAAQVLALASGRRTLVDVQRALVPLEIDLLDHVYPPDLTPGQLVRLATQALASAGFSLPSS